MNGAEGFLLAESFTIDDWKEFNCLYKYSCIDFISVIDRHYFQMDKKVKSIRSEI